MPPATEGLPPSGFPLGGNDPPRTPSAAFGCVSAESVFGSVSKCSRGRHGPPLSGRPRRNRRETVFQRKAYQGSPSAVRPVCERLGREREGGPGEGRGKPFFKKVPSPFPRFSCYLHQGALPLSQRALRACASRRVSMHCQKPVWRNMESWPSAARRSSGSFSRSQDSSSER